MPEKIVTVKFVNQPKPNKKMGSINTEEEGYIWCWPEQLDQMTSGRSYKIIFERSGDFKTLKEIIPHETSSEPSDKPSPPKSDDWEKHDLRRAARMHVTGVMGRAYQGTGTVPSFEETKHKTMELYDGFMAGIREIESQEAPF